MVSGIKYSYERGDRMKYAMTICADTKIAETISDKDLAEIEKNLGFAIGSKEHIKFIEQQVKECIEQCLGYKAKSIAVKAFDIEVEK